MSRDVEPPNACSRSEALMLAGEPRAMTAGQRSELLRHLGSCAACRRRFQQVQRMRAALDPANGHELAPDPRVERALRAAVAARRRHLPALPLRRPGPVCQALLGVAAALMVAAGISRYEAGPDAGTAAPLSAPAGAEVTWIDSYRTWAHTRLLDLPRPQNDPREDSLLTGHAATRVEAADSI